MWRSNLTGSPCCAPLLARLLLYGIRKEKMHDCMLSEILVVVVVVVVVVVEVVVVVVVVVVVYTA